MVLGWCCFVFVFPLVRLWPSFVRRRTLFICGWKWHTQQSMGGPHKGPEGRIDHCNPKLGVSAWKELSCWSLGLHHSRVQHWLTPMEQIWGWSKPSRSIPSAWGLQNDELMLGPNTMPALTLLAAANKDLAWQSCYFAALMSYIMCLPGQCCLQSSGFCFC